MDDLVVEFLTEANESLEELDLDLVNLEQNPNDAALLGKIFRLVHTIKGTCGFIGLPRLEKVAHHGENVLGRFRDGDLEVIPEYVTLIFECLDAIKYIVAQIEETGSEPDGDDSELIAKLDAAYEGRSIAEAAPAAPATQPASTAPAEDKPVEEAVKAGTMTQEQLDALEEAFNNTPGSEGMAAPVPAPAEDNPVEEAVRAGTMTQEQLDALEEAFNNAPGPAEMAPAAPAAAKPEKPSAKPAAKEGEDNAASTPVSAQSLRVNVEVLEELMTMVSELVLTRNQLMQIRPASGDGEDGYSAPLQRLNHVVSELQEGVMKTRMQPIGNAWSKLPRIVRDLAIELNKKIDLQMIGQETELDRQVLDLIKDPLTHMVRNSGDHGIETPDVRKAAGKPEMGTIKLEAFHEGGYIIIKISDDGKGLALGKIKDKAINNGLATFEELEAMSDSQITQFIFKAGFSTAEKVTSVSGRGVGMDVVRTNIEKIGGSIELDTKEGKGSTFTIKIPLTLAIVSALIVETGGERFAIPQLSVRELVLTGNENEIEDINGTPVLRLRNALLPLVSLKTMLGLEEDAAPEVPTNRATHGDDEEGDAQESVREKTRTQITSAKKYIVVTQIGSASFGIIVDRVYDTQEIVVKPVAGILKKIEIFSGNTILGDGTVIMILDPNGIARHISDVESLERQAEAQLEAVTSDTQGEKTSLLLFTAHGDHTPKAVPLALVSRLENINTSEIEHTGNRLLIQYRGRLMPLIPLSGRVDINTEQELPVLVFSHNDKSLGLIVEEIIDIANEYVDVQTDSDTPGLLGSAIIEGRATDMLDVGYFLQNNDRDWFKDHGDDPFDERDKKTLAGGQLKKRVLLVDDSPFFRNMLSPLLSVAGYDVTTLESPTAALKMCEQGREFDIIISDIEMPDMNGFEFAQKVRDGGNWQATPMVALSSHATPQDIDRGRAVGFTNYIAKFDRETLLNTLSQTLSENAGA